MASLDIPIERIRLLKAKAKEILDFIINADNSVLFITLGNPDNLCATGILMLTLRQQNIGSHAVFLDNTRNLEKRLKKFDYSTFFFIGLHISDLPKSIIEKESAKIILINHEMSSKAEIKIKETNVNTLSLDMFDIPVEALSNSGLAYYFAEGSNEEYQQFSGLAITGALSKKQINPKNQKLIGLNAMILNEGKSEGYINETKGTRIPGRESQPIHLALKYSINPYFAGLTGNESACTAFVSRLGIRMEDPDGNVRTIASLEIEETQKLNDALISKLMETENQSVSDIYKLIGPIYILNKETEKSQARNVEEFLWLLDGACQLKKHSLALAIILGDRENLYDQLIRELSNYHGKASQIIEEIANKPEKIEDKTYFRFIDGTSFLDIESTSLVINALVESGIIPIDVPLIAFIKKEKSCFLFTYESPQNIQKGFLIYHTVPELEKQKLIETVVGDEKFFRIGFKEENFDKIMDSINEAFEYHHRGKKEEKKEKKDETKVKKS